MTNKSWPVWAGGAAVLAVGLLASPLFHAHPVNRANFGRIRAGMAQEEAEAILGGKPFRSGDVALKAATGRFGLWYGEGALVYVVFSAEDGTVLQTEFTGGGPYGLLDRLPARCRDWLGW